jgi:hypothetical protein
LLLGRRAQGLLPLLVRFAHSSRIHRLRSLVELVASNIAMRWYCLREL